MPHEVWIKSSKSSEKGGNPPGWGGGEHFSGEVVFKLVLKKEKDSKVWVWGWRAVRRGHSQ